MNSNKILTSEALARTDKDLYDLIMKEGVRPNTKQIIKWFLYSENSKKAELLMKALIKILPGFKFITKCNIQMGPRLNKYAVVLETPDFLFTIQNVIKFSRSLWELASNNSCEYDFWEIEIDCSNRNNK